MSRAMRSVASSGRRVVVPCTIAVESSFENLYAHVELDGVAPGPGDSVRILEAQDATQPGASSVVFHRMAELRRAGIIERLMVRLGEPFRLLGLAEVGFSGRERP
jgi:hypothetical protein